MPKKANQILNSQFSILNWCCGQSLIEVVIAMAVIVGLAVALVTTTLVVQKASRSARNKTQATKLVQQNIEQLRILRDRKGFSFIPDGGNCYTLLSTNPDPLTWSFSLPPFVCTSGSGQLIPLNNIDFYRKIQIVTSGSTKTITVTVTWTDSGGTQSVSNQTILSSGI